MPFFVLKDFGQMMVFSAVYATLYLIAVRRFSQRFVLVGSVLLMVGVLDRRCLAGKNAGKDPASADTRRPVKTDLAESNPAAVPSMA